MPQSNIPSPYDPEFQQESVESKIVVGLEKISEVFRVMLWNASKNNNLTPTQLQFLIFLHYHPPHKCKVAVLAEEFELTKATVSEAIKSMIKKKLISKVADPNDSRSQIINITQVGLTKISRIKNFSEEIYKSVGVLSGDEKSTLYSTLFKLIDNLGHQGFIPLQSMCYKCAHYSGDKEEKHHCEFLNKTLKTVDLRVDCPDFK